MSTVTEIERLAANIVHDIIQVLDPSQQLSMLLPFRQTSFRQTSLETFGSENTMLGEQAETIVT